MRHAIRVLVIGEVVMTLEEVKDSVGGDRNGEVVVVGECDTVDEGVRSKRCFCKQNPT